MYSFMCVLYKLVLAQLVLLVSFGTCDNRERGIVVVRAVVVPYNFPTVAGSNPVGEIFFDSVAEWLRR